MKSLLKIFAVGLALAAALALVSCATTNRLAMYNFEGALLASEMQTAPPPRVDIRYNVTLDPNNAVYSSLSVLTNIAKATQGEKARQAMSDALSSVDVPGIILAESSAACADTLGTTTEERRSQADYVLTLSIHDWGIEAESARSAVKLRVRMNARITDRRTDNLVWSRTLWVAQPASPTVFGFGQIIGNMVTATVLSNLTPDELADGFRELARETARVVARLLERDLAMARGGY
jgi:ABC-type uncharacterized transport system auxiliary subunit